MIVALTGTPGCGKTTVASILDNRDFIIKSVENLAMTFGAFEGDEVDVEKLANFDFEDYSGDMIIDGHLAHYFPVDLIIVIRCNPNIIGERLKARDYPDEKIRANVESEAIDLILCEAVEFGRMAGVPVAEIDASGIPAEAVADFVEKVIANGAAGHEPGKVDWSDVVLSWF